MRVWSTEHSQGKTGHELNLLMS